MTTLADRIEPIELDEYVQALDRAFAPLLHHPHAITGHVIEIDGDRATIHAHIRTEHWVPEETGRRGPARAGRAAPSRRAAKPSL
ncbi:nuclear transport factor 2 family protein [Streptomyces albogriseolus]|uniref:nuclear transport factor 2 family protein n=1 Tax=Streptomyces albogriseolus TaxID=1887 RepID=UPI003674A0D0